MRIAVPYENGRIFPHFGHTEQFKVYDTADGRITNTAILPAGGSGHGALAALLQAQGVTALICGGIGGGARAALAEAGIALYPGAAGDADAAAAALLAGTLRYDPDTDTICGPFNMVEVTPVPMRTARDMTAAMAAANKAAIAYKTVKKAPEREIAPHSGAFSIFQTSLRHPQ